MSKDRLPILIVDDDPDSLEMVRFYLEQEGFECEVASDGAQALARVIGRRPSLIFMDGTMPGIDGWEAARRLKADPATKDILIVMLTGNSFQEDRNRAAAAGVDDFLVKPVIPQDLPAVIRRLLMLG